MEGIRTGKAAFISPPAEAGVFCGYHDKYAQLRRIGKNLSQLRRSYGSSYYQAKAKTDVKILEKEGPVYYVKKSFFSAPKKVKKS